MMNHERRAPSYLENNFKLHTHRFDKSLFGLLPERRNFCHLSGFGGAQTINVFAAASLYRVKATPKVSPSQTNRNFVLIEALRKDAARALHF